MSKIIVIHMWVQFLLGARHEAVGLNVYSAGF